MTVTIRTLETAGLGNRSYLVHDGEAAFVVDPPRTIDQVLDLAVEEGVVIEAIFETHVHNDYVSGGLALSRRTGAPIMANADDDLTFDVVGVSDGERTEVGSMTVRAIHTPGHTPTHLSYAVENDEGVCAVFTGGSLLYGTVGRTDLLGPDETDRLTRAQWSSVRSLVDDLDDDTVVYPTHGFGSFCSAQAGADRDSGTIADEKENIAVVHDDVDEFVDALLSGLSDSPAYYAHMAPLNRAGVGEPDLSPPAEVDVEELGRRLEAGEWVVDLRHRRAYADRHLIGTFNYEVDGLPTHLAWMIPWGSRLTLVAATPDDVTEAQRRLSSVGIDRPSTADLERAAASLETGRYPVVEYDELAAVPVAERDFSVVDVRRNDEFEEGHLDEAVNIPLHELLDHLHHVPAGELWVHCASGSRASIATSVLARAGYDVVLVNGGPDGD